MKWTFEAKNMLNVLPLHLRFIASKKIEKINKKKKKFIVEEKDVINIKKDREIKEHLDKYYHLNDIDYIQNLEMNICGGIRGCSLSKVDDKKIAEIFYEQLEKTEVLKIIEEYKRLRITKHRKLKAAISSCPNSCSKPQIQDISVVGYIKPKMNKKKCISCMKCEDKCPIDIIHIKKDKFLDLESCLGCGNCVRSCPTGALEDDEIGYRILLGGRLGKTPKLANIYADVSSFDELEKELNQAINLFIKAVKSGKRISNIQ